MKYLRKVSFMDLKYLNDEELSTISKPYLIKINDLPIEKFYLNYGIIYHCNNCGSYYINQDFVSDKLITKEELLSIYDNIEVYLEESEEYIVTINKDIKESTCIFCDDINTNQFFYTTKFVPSDYYKHDIPPKVAKSIYYHGLYTGWNKKKWDENLNAIINSVKKEINTELACSTNQIGDIGISVRGQIKVASGSYIYSQYIPEENKRYYNIDSITDIEKLKTQTSEIIVDVDEIINIWIRDKVINSKNKSVKLVSPYTYEFDIYNLDEFKNKINSYGLPVIYIKSNNEVWS